MFVKFFYAIILFFFLLGSSIQANSTIDNTVATVSFIDGIISNLAEIEKQSDGLVLKIDPKDKNLINSIVELLDGELKTTILNSNQIIAKLEKEIVLYKSNKDLADYLLKQKIAEEARLQRVYLKQQSKIISLKALNNLGTILNLYTFKQSIDNIVNKVEESKQISKFDYMDVLSAIISFNPIGAIGSQLYNLEKEYDKAMDITNSINDTYRDSIWAIRDQFFRQFHILATRGYEGKDGNGFIELFKKQREGLREQLINLLNDIENTVILSGKDETIKILSNVYDVIAPDKEESIVSKQKNTYDTFFQYYLEKKNAIDEQKELQDMKIYEIKLHLSDRKIVNSDQIDEKIKLFFNIPVDVSIDKNQIKAEVGDEIELTFTTLSGRLIDFVKDGVVKGKKFYIWYDSTSGRDKVELTLKSQSENIYTFNFRAPKNEFNIANFSFYNSERDEYESFSFGDFIENIIERTQHSKEELLTDGLTQDEKDSYQQCIDNGGTEIGCRVGLHVVDYFIPKTLQFYDNINDIKIKNNYAYLGTNRGLYIVDISNPGSVKYINSIHINNIIDIDIVGNYAYLATGRDGLKVVKIDDVNSLEILGSIDTSEALNVNVVGNYAYIADGNRGIKIIDISNPASMSIIASVDMGRVVNLKIRDNYLYVTDEWDGFKVMDISNPSNPTFVSSLEEISAKNIQIKGEYAYILDRYNGLKIIDISDVASPKIVSSLDMYKNKGEMERDIKIINNYIYISDDDGIKVVDIKNPLHPFITNTIVTSFTQDIEIIGNYIYMATHGLKIMDISSLFSSSFISSIDAYSADDVKIVGNYAFLADGYRGLKVIKINNDNSLSLVGSCDTDSDALKIEISGSYAYVVTSWGHLDIIDISDPLSPKVVKKLNGDNFEIGHVKDIKIIGKYAYLAENYYGENGGLRIIDIGKPLSPSFVSFIETGSALGVEVDDSYVYISDNFNGLSIIDASDVYSLVLLKSYDNFPALFSLSIDKNFLYTTSYTYGFQIFNKNKLSYSDIISSLPIYFTGDIKIQDNYAFIPAGYEGLYIVDISISAFPRIVGSIKTDYISGVEIKNDYAYLTTRGGGLKIINWQKVIQNYKLIQAYYHPTTYISLVSETNKDYTVQTQNFTKQWSFDKDISNFDIEIVSNSYAWINKDSFTKDGKTLKVTLSPDTSNLVNKLVLKFTKDGNPVKVNGSETFWSLTKTNHTPRLADGQITQLVSSTKEPAFLDIETYDGDGDSVTLSVEDSDGGYVDFSKDNSHKLFASFNDGKTEHIIKIGLSDGKEKVIKEFHVLQFDSSSIKDFYSDVSANASYPFDGIAFGTLKGVIWGQSDPNDPAKRIFRPTDDVSMAEALAMVVNAEKKAGLITLESSNYYMDIYPNWAMPYYTFARESEAIDKMSDLASYYPTREEVVKIVVKTLHLDDKISSVDLNNTFEDESDFSGIDMIRYAKVARFFGLFMTDSKAKPKEHINRAELATVIEKIFMIPSADISFNPDPVEYGESVNANVANIRAEVINSSYNLTDNSENIGVRYIYDNHLLNAPVDTGKLLISTNTLKALISNRGVVNIENIPLHVTFTDSDGDGVQDGYDAWKDDPRYYQDSNDNGIPDILDDIYDLSDYTVDDTVNIDNKEVSIRKIIADGGVVQDDNTIRENSTLTLKVGWSLISADFNLSLLDSYSIDISWQYKDGAWSAYSKDNYTLEQIKQMKSVGIITNLKATSGIWIKSNEELNLSLNDSNMTDYKLQDGWQLLGTNKDTDISDLKNTCTKYIWRYDSSKENPWELSILDDNLSFSYPYTFDHLKYGDGFWVMCKKDIKVTDGLIAYYKFDDNVLDSFKEHDLFYQNSSFMPNTEGNYVQGADNLALDLNNSKYFTQELGVGDLKEGFTVSLWVKAKTLQSREIIVALVSKDTINTNQSSLGLDLYYPSHSGWKFALSIDSEDGSHYYVYPSNEPQVQTNRWYHMVYTVNSNGKVRVWYDGNEGLGADIADPRFLKWSLKDYKLQIGSRGDGVNSDVDIDELRIYDRVLSEQEIGELQDKDYVDK